MIAPKLQWGPRPLRAFVNDQLIPWIQRGRPIRSVDCEISEREDGTLLYPRLGPSAGVAGVFRGFLQVYDASTGSSPRIGVTNGQIYSGGSWTPYLDGAPLSDDPAPTLLVTGTDIVV